MGRQNETVFNPAGSGDGKREVDKMIDAKRILKEIRTGRIEIEALIQKREQVEARATKITRSLSGMPSGSKRGLNDLSTDVTNLISLDEILKKRIESESEKERNAIETISMINNVKYRTLLTLYYIAGRRPRTWEEVAEEMGYSLSAVWHDHGKALLEYQRILDKTKCADKCS